MDSGVETVSITSSKRVWRVEIINDLDGDFEFIARLQKIRFVGDMEVSQEDLGFRSIRYSEASLDPDMAHLTESVKASCKSLIDKLEQM